MDLTVAIMPNGSVPARSRKDWLHSTVGYKGVGGKTSLVNPGHLAEVQCSAGKYFSNFTVPCPVDTYTSMPVKHHAKMQTRKIHRR